MNHAVPLAVVLVESTRIPEVLIKLSICEFVQFGVEIGSKIKHHEEADHEGDHNWLIPTSKELQGV